MFFTRQFGRSEDGSVAILTAVLFLVMMAMAAFGVDVATMFTDRRKAQSTADLAAMAAAGDVLNATAAASATIQRNKFAASALSNVTVGIYTADPSLPVMSRFQPSAAATANAARVTLATTTPLLFSRVLTGQSSFAIKTTAIATQTAFAAFSIGSGLVTLDGGLLNQMLGGMLGTTISLSAMDYQALLNADIDLLKLTKATGARMSVTAGSYNSVLASNVKLTDFVNAMLDTAKASYGSGNAAVTALAAVAAGVTGSSAKFPLSSLVGLGSYGVLDLDQASRVGATVKALDILSAAAQLANGQNQVQAALNLGIPGIASATLRLAIGERPQGTSWVTVGAAGASVHTAQTRLLLTVTLPGAGAIASVTLPVYMELASATATLSAVSCGYPDLSASTVTLKVLPSILDGWIGAVSPAAMANFTSSPNPPAAALVNSALLQVTGRAHAAISNLSAKPVNFSYADIAQNTKKTVSTTDYTASLLSGLIGDLQLDVSVLGLGIGLPGVVQQTVAGIVAAAATPLDQALSKTLASLGIGLGQAYVGVSGIRCDGAVLVN